MLVEIWSDVVCPWCYIGKRRFEKAVDAFGRDAVEVEWRSFQLDPAHPKGARKPLLQHLADKYGCTLDEARAMNDRVTALAAAEGLAYDLDSYTVVNTFDAHRMAHLARAHGLGTEMHERLLRAQLVEGQVLDDVDTLVRLGGEVGLPADETRAMLAGPDYGSEVDDDIRTARALGITGVPFFAIDRTYGIAGAQPADLIRQTLETARDRSIPAG